MLKNLFQTIAGAAALAAAAVIPAFAADFPSGPIRLVVPYAPGGSTDIVARLLADKMGGVLGQPVVVENKPGAGTIVGAELVAKSKNDGYTLLMAPATSLVTNPHLYSSLPYKLKDFTPVSLISKIPFVISVRKDAPAQTIPEFIAWAKSKPEGLNYGTTGRGSTSHITAELLSRELDLKMVDVVYSGASLALNDVLSGMLDMHIDGITTSIPNHKAGTLRIVGVMSDQRSPAIPNVPTFKEAGFPGAISFTWFGIVAPAGTPEPVVKILSDAAAEAMSDPALRERFIADGMIPDGTDAAAFGAYIDAEYKRWGDVIAQTGIKLD